MNDNHKWMNPTQKERFYYYSLYTLIFSILCLCVFGIFIKNGRSFVFDGGGQDGISQHYISLVYMGNYLREILRNLFINHKLIIPQWDTSLGLGADIITTMNYYVLGDPLNLLAVFVSPENTEYLYAALIILRLYLAGITFSMYCRYWKFRPFYILLGSCIYCFCSYALYTGIMHPFFLNPMIYFPLLLLGIEKIFEKKSPAIFIWSVFCAAVSNFYFFYMLSIFMFLYAVFRYIMIFGKIRLKELTGWLMKFIGFYLLGIGLSGILFLPNVISILSSSRISASHYIPLLYQADYYEKFLATFVFNNCGYYTLLGFSSMAFLSMVLLFMKKGNLHLKLASILLTLFFIVPYIGHVLNGFTYVSNRWSWSYAFLVALISVKMLPELAELKTREKWKVCVIVLAYTLLALFPKAARDKGRLAAVALIWCCLFAVLVMLRMKSVLKKTWKTVYMPVLMLCTAAGILLNVYARYASFGADMAADCAAAGEVLDQVKSSPVHLLADSGENTVQTRMDTSNISDKMNIRNAGCIQNVQSTSFYFSTANQAVAKFLREMYLNTPMEQSYTSLDGRYVLNALTGCQYTAVRNGDEQYLPYGYEEKTAEDAAYSLYQSDISLPFSYVYDSYMDRENYDKLTVTQKQQAALQTCILTSDDQMELKNTSDSVVYTDQEMPYELESSDDVEVKDGEFLVREKGSSIKLHFEGMDDCETYVIVEGMDYQALPGEEEDEAVAVNLKVTYGNSRKNIRYMTNKDNFYCGIKEFLCNLGYRSKGEGEIEITFPYAGVYKMSDLKIVCQPMKGLADLTAIRKQNGLSDVAVKDNSVKGSITAKENQMLCITVPYSEGWTAYIDGKESKLYQVNTLYSGVYVTPGEHTVEMKYHTPYFREGAVLSLISFLITLGIMIRRKN